MLAPENQQVNPHDRTKIIRSGTSQVERRDPAGFGRWLDTQPQAGSDPGRFLTVNH